MPAYFYKDVAITVTLPTTLKCVTIAPDGTISELQVAAYEFGVSDNITQTSKIQQQSSTGTIAYVATSQQQQVKESETSTGTNAQMFVTGTAQQRQIKNTQNLTDYSFTSISGTSQQQQTVQSLTSRDLALLSLQLVQPEDVKFQEWLRKDNEHRVVLAEVNYYDPAPVIETTPAFTFTRNSIAYKSDGTQVAAGALRYEQGKFNEAVFVEEGTTNLVKSNFKVTAANIGSDNSGKVIKVSSEQTFSGTSSIKITFVAGTICNIWAGTPTLTQTAGTAFTASFKVRRSDGGVVSGLSGYLYVSNNSNVNGTMTITALRDGWYLCTYTRTGLVSGSVLLAGIYGFSSAYSYYIDDWQVEAKPYATSFAGYNITRPVESLTVPTAGLFSSAGGTIECWAKASRNASDYQMVLSLWSFFYVGMYSTNKVILSWRNGSGVQSSSVSTLSLNSSSWNNWCVIWSTNQVWLYVNGVLFCTSGVTTFQSIPSYLTVGAFSGGGYYLNGLIDNLRISNATRGVTEIQAAARSRKPLAWDDRTTALYNFDVAQERTLYIASMPFNSKPTDTPANQIYEDCIVDIPKFSSSLNESMEGFTLPSWGDIVVDNSSWDKDQWLTYGWGRKITLLFGSPYWNRSDFKAIQTCIVQNATAPNSNQVKLALKDTRWELNKAIQTNLVGEPVLISGTTYKVSESPVDSIDEVWDDGILLATSAYTTSPESSPATFTLNEQPAGRLSVSYTGGTVTTGQVVPLGYGEVFNATPVQISEPYQIYQVNEDVIFEMIQVRDGGIPVTYTYTSNPNVIRLDYKPVGDLTCDFKGASAGGVFVEGVGRIIRWILLNQTDYKYEDINHASLSAFVDTCPQRVGIYIKERRNILDVVDDLIKSVGGFYTPDRNGKLFFGRIEPVPSNPVLELTGDDFVKGSLKIVKQSTPWETVRIAYGKNYTVQSTVHGAVTDEDKAKFAQEWKYEKRRDPKIKTAHTLAIEPDAKQTLLVDSAEAAAEAERLLQLHGVVRTTYSVECFMAPLTLNLGDVVKVTYNRYGLNYGKLLYVVKIDESVISRKVNLTLWG